LHAYKRQPAQRQAKQQKDDEKYPIRFLHGDRRGFVLAEWTFKLRHSSMVSLMALVWLQMIAAGPSQMILHLRRHPGQAKGFDMHHGGH
jgi:hypothetical protein